MIAVKVRFFALLLAAALLNGCATQRSTIADAIAPRHDAVPVILISIDGFRPDYLDRGVTPNLNALADAGVRTRGMRPSFPTNTFPNHYTLVTGLRPDDHGIVDNSMRDPGIPGVTFELGAREAILDPRWWNGAEPIWVTAEKHGIPTAVMFWPGSEVPIHGVRPRAYARFDGRMPGEARVDTILSWLDVPVSSRPRFLALYLNAVDKAGHAFGPNSAETTKAIASVDAAIGRLRTGLHERGIKANLIIVSDHGMAEASAVRTIPVKQIASEGTYELVYDGATAGFDPKPGKRAMLEAGLLAHHQHVRCWRKDRIPARYHYGRHTRVPAYMCLADVGWSIGTGARGMHGYDNRAPEMLAVFLAAGPAFKTRTKLGIVDNIDVYPFIMKILGLRPHQKPAPSGR